MPRPCATTLLRQVLAALTVVAAFAFQMRVGGMVDTGWMDGAMPMPMAGQAGGMAAHHAAAPVRSPLQSSEAVSLTPGSHHNQESHNHAAHCPFCITGAFALEAGVLPLPTAPPRLTPQPQDFSQTHHPATVRHADARAPPILL